MSNENTTNNLDVKEKISLEVDKNNLYCSKFEARIVPLCSDNDQRNYKRIFLF